MQAALGRHQRLSRLQVQVVGVGQQDSRAGLRRLLGQQRLDGGLGGHGHEDGGFHLAPGRLQHAQARPAVG